MSSAQNLQNWLHQDRTEVYGHKGSPSIYPSKGDFNRIVVTDAQNFTRLKTLASLIGGSCQVIEKPLPTDLLRGLKYTKRANETREGYEYGTIVQLVINDRTAIVRLFGEHLFMTDVFIGGKLAGGNHDTDIMELSHALTTDQHSPWFAPGMLRV